MNESYLHHGKTDILSLLPEELSDFFVKLGQPRYRAKQVFSALARGCTPAEMTNLPKDLRKTLEETTLFALPSVERKLISAIDGTVKYLFRLHDGACIESVLMHYAHGNTLCISSQVGCRMGCRFCASTIGGKVRDLYPSEMLGQIIAAEKDSGERVSNVVMMGIGEPLDNFDHVVRFLHLVNHADGVCIGYRHISLSTCGLADRILDLAKINLPITLSISLHAPTNELRDAIMPVNRHYPLEVLFAACRTYYRTTGRRISFEYTLIAGKNDSREEARQLADCLLSAFAETGAPLHVNLIRVNEVAETGFHRGTTESVNAFAAYLEKRGIVATVRRRLGADVNAACGQLRRAAVKEQAGVEETTE